MKMPTIVGSFIFISGEIFTPSYVEHENFFITSGPEVQSVLHCVLPWISVLNDERQLEQGSKVKRLRVTCTFDILKVCKT